MSQMKYILKLQSDNSWILGTVHSSQHKPDAEKNALESLAIHIRAKVRAETVRKLEELISLDEEFIQDRRSSKLEVITDETIMNPRIITINNNGFWSAIALKCKDEYSQEAKDYNEKLYLESKSYYEKFVDQPIYTSDDVSTSIENLIKSFILINNLISFDQNSIDLFEFVNKELDILLNKIKIKTPKQNIEVSPYSFSNDEIDLRCEYHSDLNKVISMDGIDLIAEYTQGSVENFNGWGNSRKNLSVTNGNIIFDTGYINTKSVDLEVILYPDIDYIVSSLEEKYHLWDLSYIINPETIIKLKKIIKEHSSTKVLNLLNSGKIPTFIELDSKVRLPRINIQNEINSNPLFNVTNNPKAAIIVISIRRLDNELIISLLLRDQDEQLEKISEKKIKRSSSYLKNIEAAVSELLESMFETNLEYEIGNYDDCDENVTIVIENAKYDIPREIRNNSGQERSGSITVKKGKVNYKIYYNKDNSSAFYDTTFYVTNIKDLNDFRKLCFEKKQINYLLTFSSFILAEKKSKLKWDGKNAIINSGNVATKIRGFRHNKHNIVYKKNGFHPFVSTINPTSEIEYPIHIEPEKIRLNIRNNMKHVLLPGSSQIDLYRASLIKQMQGYIYEASYIFLLGKTLYHYYNHNNHLDKYNKAKDEYYIISDQSEEYYQTKYNELYNQHKLMSQEQADFETFKTNLTLLLIANFVEVTINNIIFK